MLCILHTQIFVLVLESHFVLTQLIQSFPNLSMSNTNFTWHILLYPDGFSLLKCNVSVLHISITYRSSCLYLELVNSFLISPLFEKEFTKGIAMVGQLCFGGGL